jgi:hypothetical protein
MLLEAHLPPLLAVNARAASPVSNDSRWMEKRRLKGPNPVHRATRKGYSSSHHVNTVKAKR